MKNLKLVLIMFVLSVANVTFGLINYNPIVNDCGCGCGKKDEGPVDREKQSKGIGDDDYIMICKPEISR